LVGRKRKPFTWSANLESATLSALKDIILQRCDLKAEFDKEETSLEFTIDGIGEKYKPVSDSDFRDLLQRMVDRHAVQFTVSISTPSKAFSSYDLDTVCKLYGINDSGGTFSAMFPKLDCGLISKDTFEQDLTNFTTDLEKHLLITPFDGTNEATKSIYVYLILHAAISIFGASKFTIYLEKYITGAHGHGPVDYAIDSRLTKKTVGVTEVKDEDFKQGIAQNVVQLESCLTTRKRKASEIEDVESPPGRAFGIISDAEKFYFLECRINGDGKTTFKLSESVIIDYRSEFMKDMVAKVLGHIGWLLEEVEKPDLSSAFVKKRRTSK